MPAERIAFSLAAFLGAALLFLLEPMFARMVLPLLGGAPAVWNTCLVFYQVALLAGYLYAHLISVRLHPRTQILLQVVLLLVAAATLPIGVRGDTETAAASTYPILWVFRLLAGSLGLPFFVLATTGPLLQRWFAALGRPASDPYSLFAASNAGSFVALLGYPLLVEPAAGLREQSVGWTAAYAVFVALMIVCGARVWLAGHAPAVTRASGPGDRGPANAGRGRHGNTHAAADDLWSARVRWLGLAAIPSTLMLSVTTFISVDIAAVPLLWVVPLALYLLTFVVAFADRQFVPRRLLAAIFPVAVVLLVALAVAPPIYPAVVVVVHLAGFTIVALACHLQLSADRPPTDRLTEFYLWIAAGGAVGGFFNALVAPVIFVNPFEYPLAAISACLLLPDAAASTRRTLVRQAAGWVLTAIPALLVVSTVLLVQRVETGVPQDLVGRYLLIFGPAVLLCLVLRKDPLRMGLALAFVAMIGSFVRFDHRVPLHVERTFFGVHRVLHTGGEHVLQSGTTNHGVQSVDPAHACEPLSYYSRGGPIGQAIDARPSAAGPGRRVGVVGLGTASMAAYAQPGDRWTFYELNPAVERLARNAAFFTYLRDCAPDAVVVIGDARLMLEREPDGAFDMIVLDAFSSDAVPVHLMTLEAMQLYLRKLAPGGIVAVHVSNRFLSLTPVVAAVARQSGLVGVVQLHVPTTAQYRISLEITPSRWAIVARQAPDLGSIARDPRWEPLEKFTGPVWTDDYSNVFQVLQR